ncbi:hypothetical protein [Segatella oulorum]|uniref:hypothetical protein n=1 Tax=Segatella oulorum TaxID=28136 RepID=UPI0028EEDDD1|nr:hypothetical protein [Segatella oulorum]
MCLVDGQTAKYSALDFFLSFIVAAPRGNNIFAILSSPRSAETIFLPFYRHRAAREQYFCRFIVAAQRGNDILPFYRHRAARKRYFCRFIVAVQRGNDIFPFYHRRSAFLQMHLLRL